MHQLWHAGRPPTRHGSLSIQGQEVEVGEDMTLDLGKREDKVDEKFSIDTRDNFTKEMAQRVAYFQDMHGRNLFKRNMLPFDAEHADPKKLEELGYAVDIQSEHKGNCTHYKMRLLKIVDVEEYSINYKVDFNHD